MAITVIKDQRNTGQFWGQIYTFKSELSFWVFGNLMKQNHKFVKELLKWVIAKKKKQTNKQQQQQNKKKKQINK